MKKAFAALAVIILFFAIGRNQPPVVTISHTDFFTQRQQPNAPAQQKIASESSPTEQAFVDNVRPEPQLSLFDRLATQVDSELFETLFSPDFKQRWSSALPTLQQRLYSELPNPKEDEATFEKELTARLGIIKALGKTDEENNQELKDFLFGYVDHLASQRSSEEVANSNPNWLLQREAAHALSQYNDLSEEEQQKLSIQIDPRARSTAASPDQELIERAVAGDE